MDRACRLLGVPRASWYRYLNPPPTVTAPIPQKDRHQPAALTGDERQLILERINCEDTADLNIAQIRVQAMDQGLHVASEATWYRIARAAQLAGDRRRTATHPPKKIPELCASRPNQVWSWDITVLPTVDRGRNLRLYVVLDVFSRAVVAWRLEPNEKGFKAAEMLEKAFVAENAKPEVLHADRGSIMTGVEVSSVLAANGITQSHSRPRVSNDNPFSEAQFKTMKYSLDYPGRFTTIDHARTWVSAWIGYYNNCHLHSGIGYYTPASVHDSSWTLIRDQRQALLNAHYTQHPGRYRRPP
ncbi:IS3 family transposase, partial [Arthrobacter pigmenti]